MSSRDLSRAREVFSQLAAAPQQVCPAGGAISERRSRSKGVVVAGNMFMRRGHRLGGRLVISGQSVAGMNGMSL